jgi:hypothetical protein
MTGRRSCRRASRDLGTPLRDRFRLLLPAAFLAVVGRHPRRHQPHSLRCKPDAIHLHCRLVGEGPGSIRHVSRRARCSALRHGVRTVSHTGVMGVRRWPSRSAHANATAAPSGSPSRVARGKPSRHGRPHTHTRRGPRAARLVAGGRGGPRPLVASGAPVTATSPTTWATQRSSRRRSPWTWRRSRARRLFRQDGAQDHSDGDHLGTDVDNHRAEQHRHDDRADDQHIRPR